MKKTGVLEVPQVVKAGSFNSRQKFGGMDATHPRLVKDYELELFTQDGGTTYLDGLGYPIKEGALLLAALARPGTAGCTLPAALSTSALRKAERRGEWQAIWTASPLFWSG